MNVNYLFLFYSLFIFPTKESLTKGNFCRRIENVHKHKNQDLSLLSRKIIH